MTKPKAHYFWNIGWWTFGRLCAAVTTFAVAEPVLGPPLYTIIHNALTITAKVEEHGTHLINIDAKLTTILHQQADMRRDLDTLCGKSPIQSNPSLLQAQAANVTGVPLANN